MDEPHTHTDKSRSGDDALVICYVHPTEFIRQQMKVRSESQQAVIVSDTEDLAANKVSIYSNALIRRFDFSSALQRMSVICKNEIDNVFRVFVKGSPEKICELCDAQTIPRNFEEILE